MDRPEEFDTFPIVLIGPRPLRWVHLGLLVAVTIAVFVVSLSVNCSGCVQWGLTLGFVGAFLTIGFAVDRIRLRGSERAQLVIDREGFVNDGRRVPWESVVSITWVAARGGDGPPEQIHVGVRSTPGFEAPRQRVVYVSHGAFGIAPNTLIYLFETAALPRCIQVLALEPPLKKR